VPGRVDRSAPGSCRRSDRGYSVIELAIVLAVTALIAAVGASAYRTHAARTEVAHGIALAARAQDAVTRAFERYGEPPSDNAAAGLPGATGDRGAKLDSIEVVDGRIELRFGKEAHPALASRTLSVTPFETVDGAVVWVCGNRVPGAGLEPLGFASGGRQAVQVVTQIEARYLPSSCR
jgi:type IV pilus assembly protein PilA